MTPRRSSRAAPVTTRIVAVHRVPVAIVAFLVLAAPPADSDEIRFAKTLISKRFLAEGCAVADVDGDGQRDILAGAMWFQAPDWKPHEIAPAQEFVPYTGYSDSFLSFADDLNGDGRADFIVVGFPGEALRIYENPGEPGKHWNTWNACASAANESPQYLDVDGDGRAELLCGSNPQKGVAGAKEEQWVGWFEPRAWREPWKWQPIDGPSSPGGQRYSHGLGRGDVNGDGRDDVLIAHGWYEAPFDRARGEWKLHPFPDGIRDRPSAHLYTLDIDGDGDSDVIASSAHARGIWWYEQTRTASGGSDWKDHDILAETLPPERWFTQTHSLVVADINRDGLPDFVTGKRWFAHQGNDPDGRNPVVPIYWFELQREAGRARFVAHRIDDNSGVGTQLQVVDVNGDDKLDVVVANKKGVHYLEQQ